MLAISEEAILALRSTRRGIGRSVVMWRLNKGRPRAVMEMLEAEGKMKIEIGWTVSKLLASTRISAVSYLFLVEQDIFQILFDVKFL